jgi:hypothetical protein
VRYQAALHPDGLEALDAAGSEKARGIAARIVISCLLKLRLR